MQPIRLAPVQHFIDDQFCPGVAGRTFPTFNPADGAPIADVAEGLAEDVDLAVRAARKAFEEGPWPRLPARERARLLRRVGDLVERHADEIVRLETLDTGLPIGQARNLGARAAENFFFYAELATRITGESFPVGNQFINYTIRKPVGVAGLITPWNQPLMLSTWKVAPCLAAGNTCILKPAEWSPLSANKLAEIMQEAEVPAGVFNVVHGFGESCGAALVAHPRVQLISFTGETTTGMEIMRNGAATLKRLSMELGGKSPAVVFADADPDAAVDAIVFGVYALNGQRCAASSRLLIEAQAYDRIVAAVADRARRIRVGDPMDERTEMGPLIHADHLLRVQDYVQAGKDGGAVLAVGGGRPAHLPAGNYIEPTLFTNVRNDMRIAQEEIFGPVLAAIPFRDETEAIRLANDVKYGLAGYVWTSDLKRGHRVAQAIEAGMTWVNAHNVRDLRTPFGGAKYSGIGREGGHHSFEFYTELQTVHVAIGGAHTPRLGV